MVGIIGAGSSDAVSAREHENDLIAYRAALESIVLLRNNGALPLKEKRIALFGSGASHTIKGGTGSGEVNNRHSVSIYEGLLNRGVEVTSEDWIREYDALAEEEHAKWLKEHQGIPSVALLSLAFNLPHGRITEKDADGTSGETALYVVSRIASEGRELRLEDGEFTLRKQEIEDIQLLYKNYKKLVVVINSGSVMDISELDDLDVSIIYYGYGGQAGGSALADLLLGNESFSGKLADTWMKKYEDVPCGNEYSLMQKGGRDQYYREDIYVGYRYYDTFGIEPRFPFGFGLTYSEFDITCETVRQNGRNIEMDIAVKNTGSYAGKEVVQVYVSCPQGRMAKEYQRLVCFEKTEKLNSGESQKLTLSFDMYGCASYDEEKAAYVLEKGDYVIRAGNSSRNTSPCATVIVSNDVALSEHENIFKGYQKFDMIDAPVKETEEIAGIQVIDLDVSCFKKKRYSYGKPEVYSDEKVDRILNQLSEEDMIELLVGMGMMGMIDHKGFYVPGGVGKTTTRLMKKGLMPVVLADGPAGLRLIKKSGMTKRGGIRFYKDNYLISFMEVMPPLLLKLISPSKKDRTLYQFATAFPANSTLAQCWNVRLAKEVGYAVSREMDEYNITYWLAPGMNIHRNPLCGRNFEYYSEDPVLTGKISAAITRGVQKIEGNYTTIKHFCCNNASEESNLSDSHVTERALREIYLKGFEINIKESSSRSVMTSYNKVNGIYAPNSYDLCTKILRNEWGFDGAVMTDWTSTDPDQDLGKTDIAISVGNDIIMPGGKKYRKAISEGLKNGTVSSEDLKRAAANVIRSIVYSNAVRKTEDKL